MNEKQIVPVNVRTMRHVYRDIISVSAAGESMYQVLASISPIIRLDVCAIAWTGRAEAPVAIRREESWGRDAVELPQGGNSLWWHFAKNSVVARLVAAEYEAYYPDARRNYSWLVERGSEAYKIVIGNHLISIHFDQTNPFARLKQQINSLLDMVTQALLDYFRRQIRHYQDQIIFSLGQDQESHAKRGENQVESDVRNFLGEGNEAASQSMELLERNATVIASFFDISRVEYLLAPDISKLVLYRQVLDAREYNGVKLHSISFTVGDFAEGDQARMLEFPMQWGSSNEEDKFFIRLYSNRDINAHVRKSLLLGQVLIKCKEQVETLFDRRYREHRIYQDNKHFERCKAVRNHAGTLAVIRQLLHDSVAEYEEMPRSFPRKNVFPLFEDWSNRLAAVIKNLDDEYLEFRDEIRLRDLREYKYLNMRVPEELRKILLDAMNPDVYIEVESPHPVLRRMSDLPAGLNRQGYERKQIFFNDAATISVLFPREPYFRFHRLKGKFLEYLESVGEGFGKIFSFINTQTGIKNRLALMQSLEYFVHQVEYSNLVILEVSSLDISSFKIFNELFGHPFGDRIIRYTAHQLDECSPGYAFHVSGDEYYIVHCYHQKTNESWMADFFRSREIISEESWQDYRQKLDRFTNGIPLQVPFSDVQEDINPESYPLGTYKLVDFIGNFFSHDSSGAVVLKKYSRTGNDYQNVIFDHQARVQKLVDLCWPALKDGSIVLGEASFASFVHSHNTIGGYLEVIPSLTIGTVSYNWKNILPYVSDIVDAADHAAGKNKK